MSSPMQKSRGGWLPALMTLAIIGAASLVAPVPVVFGQSEAPSPIVPPSLALVPASPIVPPSMAPGSAPTLAWHGVTNPSAAIWSPRIDPLGHIWTSALDSSTFSIFDTNGTLLETWGTAGKEDGQFHSGGGPRSITVTFNPDGSFAVADAGNHRVQTFDKDRNHVATWGTFGPGENELIAPTDIATDANGNVYVFDEGPNLVKEFTADGTFVRSVACGGPFIGVTPDGTVLAGSQREAGGIGALNRCGPDGSITPWIDLSGLASFITGIVIGIDGDIWVGSETSGGDDSRPEHLMRFSPDGTLKQLFDVGVEGFAIDPTGEHLYTAFFMDPYLAAYTLPAK
jgi:NHL repeat